MNNEEKILHLLEQVIDEQKSMRSDLTDMRSDLTDMRTELTRVAVTQENIVLPQLQLLFEGQVTIQEQIKNISVIDRMQDDISILKAAVKHLTTEVEALRSAG